MKEFFMTHFPSKKCFAALSLPWNNSIYWTNSVHQTIELLQFTIGKSCLYRLFICIQTSMRKANIISELSLISFRIEGDEKNPQENKTNRMLASRFSSISSSESWISILYTDRLYMPLADSQNKAKIYSVFLYPLYSSLAELNTFIIVFYYTFITH